MSIREKKLLDRGRNILRLQKIYHKMEFIVNKARSIVEINDMNESPLRYLLKS